MNAPEIPEPLPAPERPPNKYSPHINRPARKISGPGSATEEKRRKAEYIRERRAKKALAKYVGDDIVQKELSKEFLGVPRKDMVAALAYHGDKRFYKLAHLLLTEEESGVVGLLARCRVTTAEFMEAFKRYRGDKNLAKLYQGSLDVVGRVVEDAQGSVVSCRRCDGKGSIHDQPVVWGDDGGKVLNTTRKCPRCRGTGECREIGDKASKSLVFEAVGLTSKGGPLVAIQQNIQGLDSMETVVGGKEGLVPKRRSS